MTPQQVLEEYGSQAEIARVLGCTQPSVKQWFDDGFVPEGRQYQLQIASGGTLKADKPADRRAADEVLRAHRRKQRLQELAAKRVQPAAAAS